MKMTFDKKLTVLAFAALLGLTGCFNGADDAFDVARAHPITVEPEVVTLMIPTPHYKDGLTASDRAQIEGIAQAYKDRGHGPLTISSPSGSVDTGAALNIMSELREVLAEKGIPESRIDYTPYSASSADGTAPVIISFKRYVATASACGDWSEDLAFNPSNGYAPNYGCATQNNLAAMVADPADLIAPRTMTPSDASRRATVIGKYQRGEVTSSQKDTSDTATVSGVAQ